MRKTFVLIAAALMAFGAVSCKKEIENNDLSNRPVRFSATMENSGDSKTTLNGHALLWADGDQVKVMCDEFTTAGVYQVVSGGKRNADFVFAGEESSEETLVAPFKAGYPADYWNDNVTSITLPATQNYVANGMEKFPMYGEVEEGFGVDFKNVCGVIRLRLTKPNESVSKIVITTNRYMNGEFSVSATDGIPAINHVDGGEGTNLTTLVCDNPVSISSAVEFYIYLPAGTYNRMRIEVYNARGLFCEMNSSQAINIERNKITTIAPPASSLNFDFVAGLISVSDNKQVYFAKGNLIYENNAWRFGNTQYECYNNSVTGNVPRDRFYASGALSNYGLTNGYPSGRMDYSEYLDWGDVVNDDNTVDPWYTLSDEEWSYAVSTGSTQPGFAIRGKKNMGGTINLGNGTVVYGLILVPDNWSSIDERFNGNGGMSWNQNVYTVEEWQDMEASGAVFIPHYNGSTTTNSYYWTCSPELNDWALMRFKSNRRSSSSGQAYDLNAVRLVRTYHPIEISE